MRYVAKIVGMLVVSCSFFVVPGASAQCGAGPDFCQDDPRIARALERKKATLRREYPERLVALLDIGPQCLARIERSPDVFTLVLVRPNGDWSTFPWSEEDETRAKNQLADGQLARYWIVHAQSAFACHGERPAEERPDWRATEKVSASRAILCERTADRTTCRLGG